MNPIVTRLAPSPTGALHLGNARTFLANYLLARQNGWRVLMRVEDLDSPRVKAGATEQALDELAWLGLTWEKPIIYQSQRDVQYRATLQTLIDAGKAYPCICTRKDIEQAASAPHSEDSQRIYPGTCCKRFASAEEAQKVSGLPVAWRVKVNNRPIVVDDQFAGRKEFFLARTCGDFVIYKNTGEAAYQLAVVIDDADAGINAIVRGDDLLESAARQIHLRRLLSIPETVQYWHLPLVVGPDGRRLAKRHGDTRLEHYRAAGTTIARTLGLLGYWLGALKKRRETTMSELLEQFDIGRVSKNPIVFSPEDNAFLLS